MPKLTIFAGEYRVSDVKGGDIALEMGSRLWVLHLGNLPHLVKPGDMLPLYTEVPYAPARKQN